MTTVLSFAYKLCTLCILLTTQLSCTAWWSVCTCSKCTNLTANVKQRVQMSQRNRASFRILSEMFRLWRMLHIIVKLWIKHSPQSKHTIFYLLHKILWRI